jgi:hypothetical protein
MIMNDRDREILRLLASRWMETAKYKGVTDE